MTKYITTYFYHDEEDLGASYGNIFLPLVERNIIYWQTVYTLFFSSIVFNRYTSIKYILFTNIKFFPFRNEIEALGVKVYDNLSITKRSSGKWATVKFFFDVINFINNNSDFTDDDIFLMLDNDVICLNKADSLFEYVQHQNAPVAYVLENQVSNNQDFHGLNLLKLCQMGCDLFGHEAQIKRLIGGEFFCFRKDQTKDFVDKFNLLKNLNELKTEEQILTLVDTYRPWANFPKGIFRVWTTLRVFKIPSKNSDYTFLHLPSEKEIGLKKLFKLTVDLNPAEINEMDFRNLFFQSISLNHPFILYLSRFLLKIFTRVKGLFV